MRRFWLIMIIIPLLIGYSNTVQAQGNIANIINARDDLSTLEAFLNAAPTVWQTLETMGGYTLFAPNNTAFNNLEESLNIPLADLMGSIDIVTALIQYHTVPERLSANQIAERNGQVIPTLLPSAFVGIRVDENDHITLNNVVEVLETDILAGNGRIHIINDVLLNRVIDDLVDELNLSEFIISNVTATPTEISATDEATPAATALSQNVANLRLIHLSPDTPSIRVSVDDTDNTLTYADSSDFMTLSQGIFAIEIRNIDMGILASLDVTLFNGDFTTLALVGSLANDTLEVVAFEHDFSPMADDTARLMFIHAMTDTPALDILLDDEPVTESIVYQETRMLDIADGRYTLQVALDNRNTLVIEQAQVELNANTSYFIALAGTREEPNLFIFPSIADTDSE